MEVKESKKAQSDITRIVFYGPESTGKTTLAKKLAQHFNTKWVPEFARDLLQQKFENTGKACEASDIRPIVDGQLKTENKLIQKANQYLFCDTDPLETYVYAKVYFPEDDFTWLDHLNERLNYDHYFLTYIDTPWIEDDLRDKPNERERMYEEFLKELRRRNKKFTILKGDLKTRTKTVLDTIKGIQA
jgi:NadR type nicotinamide-nucleotide adenylyltransferase